MMANETTIAPMTRGELAMVTRLLTEVHRLRLKTRLQRRTIAELAAHVPARLEATIGRVDPGAEALVEVHGQGQEEGLRQGKLDMLDTLATFLGGNDDMPDLGEWIDAQRAELTKGGARG